MKPLKEARLYCFSPGDLHKGRDPAEMVAAQIRGGADVIQLREKAGSKRRTLELGFRIKQITKGKGVPLIVNDDLDLAMILDADGVHLGQDDIPIEYARRYFKKKIIGISTHSVEQAIEAIDSGANYIGIGPVFSTATKFRPDPLVETGTVSKITNLSPVPVIPIGGINEKNIQLLVSKGIKRAAIISDIFLSDDIEGKTRRFKEILSGI